MKLTPEQKEELKQLKAETIATEKAKRDTVEFEAMKKKVVANAKKKTQKKDMKKVVKRIASGGKKIASAGKKAATAVKKSMDDGANKPPRSFDLMEGFGQDVGANMGHGMEPPQGKRQNMHHPMCDDPMLMVGDKGGMGMKRSRRRSD